MPEKKFSQKPNHMAGRNLRISPIGTLGATPRMRNAIAALMPAASPIPTVWHDRIAGKAKSDGDPRTHSLAAVDSIQAKNGILGKREYEDVRRVRRCVLWCLPLVGLGGERRSRDD